MNNELSALFPTESIAWVGKRPVKIKPVAFKDFELFGRASVKALGLLCDPTVDQISKSTSRADIKDLRALISACTDLGSWRINRLPATVILQLAGEVIIQNADFFGQALLHTEKRLAGALQFSDSLEQGTASAK